ncbi:MAG: hypothetical protein HYW50_02375 [Candidatus Diapherotrites archaeon]|nr:hypothetical protein [Candidatus Diapherotrites archaeon]
MAADTETLIYGFALFFIFFTIVFWLIRYSNRELVKKFANLYDLLKNAEKDLRHLAEVEMHGKNELKKEIAKLKEEIESLKNGMTKRESKLEAIVKAKK